MTVIAKHLTKLEKARFRRWRKSHPGAKCYYSTDYSLGVGYDIIASVLDLTTHEGRMQIDNVNSKVITDEENELKKM